MIQVRNRRSQDSGDGTLYSRKFLVGFVKILHVSLIVAGEVRTPGLTWPATPLDHLRSKKATRVNSAESAVKLHCIQLTLQPHID